MSQWELQFGFHCHQNCHQYKTSDPTGLERIIITKLITFYSAHLSTCCGSSTVRRENVHQDSVLETGLMDLESVAVILDINLNIPT